jgi:hypothetical protein
VTYTMEDAKVHGFDFRGHHLLCAAVADKARFTAMGYAAMIFPVTMLAQKFTVYFVAYQKLDRPTRKERGCYV